MLSRDGEDSRKQKRLVAARNIASRKYNNNNNYYNDDIACLRNQFLCTTFFLSDFSSIRFRNTTSL